MFRKSYGEVFSGDESWRSLRVPTGERFAGLEEDAATRRLVAAAVCAEQVIDLIDRGVTHIHFYTMNRADLVYAICHLIGLRPPRDKVAPELAA